MKPNRKKNSTSIAWRASNLPFATNYNDHFETPLQAYLDIKPVIDWLSMLQVSTTDETNLRLYDPYYCNGRTVKQLNDLGYDNIVHEKRDFYLDISNNTVPGHDIFITNPPFSDSHKARCLGYCFKKLRQTNGSHGVESNKKIPFLLLMPAYVAAKQYYRDFLSKELDSADDIVYLVPSTTYKYDHPENTGKDYCPFESLWFFGIEKDQIESFQIYWNSLALETRSRLTLATTLSQLQNFGVISATNRPNPKQRNRQRKRLRVETSNIEHSPPKKSTKNVNDEDVKPVKSCKTEPETKRKRRF